MLNLKMLPLISFFFLCSALLVKGEVLHSIPAVLVPNEHLQQVSMSVLKAESWTRANVLAHYPSTNVSTIVVGHKLLCEKGEEQRFSLVLPSLKNIHHTLTRWGLHKEIKASVSFSSACLVPDSSGMFRPDLAEIHIKPILSFLQETNSPYIATDENMAIAVKSLGFSNFNNIHVAKSMESEPPNTRKGRKILSFLDFLEEKIQSPFPAKPTPFSGLSPASSPAYSFSSPPAPWPETHPVITPAGAPYLPPCNPSYSGGGGGSVAAAPQTSHRGLWCVAKPSVPPETLQQALDYACGQGGGDCSSIKPKGSCYYPDSLVAHASVAFNSYWQKNKAAGGTCGFGGTAILIDSDPSYGRCRYTLG